MSVLKTEFCGDRGTLFQLAMKTGFLTVLTVGFYRFWQTTRFRRWYWSSIRPGGVGLEYAGTALEKLTGFLFAIVLLATYLALFNIVAMFTAIRISAGNPDLLTFGFAATPLALVPVIFAARYRARTYLLSRTRWRGIRFGMSPGAWGYAWRACMYWTLTILTLGLLLPLMAFQLEKFLTDRTWYGNTRFTQKGWFGQLIGPALPLLLVIWSFVAVVLVSLVRAGTFEAGLEFSLPERLPPDIPPGLGWLQWATGPIIVVAVVFWVYFRVAAFRVLTAGKTLGEGVTFDIHPRTRSILYINVFGTSLTNICTFLVTAIVFGIAFGIARLTDGMTLAALGELGTDVLAMIFAAAGLIVFVFYAVFRQIFITFPLVRHVAQTLQVRNSAGLAAIRQRDRADARDAGGFAEALDVGAAF